MKINLGTILTRAWQIIWNHKVLWVFGVLAGFANGGGSGNSSNRSSSEFNQNGNSNPFQGGEMEQFSRQFTDFFQRYMLIIIAVCVFIIILSFVFYALGMMGRIGILKGVFKLEQGASSLMFAELWSESMPYFWRFFGLNLLVGLAFLVVMLPFFAIAFLTMGLGLACLLPLLCLLVPVAWVVGVIVEQAQAAIVAEDLNMLDAFRRGWEIVRSDVGGMVALALILGIGGAIIGFVLALPIIVALLPLIFAAPSMDSFSSVPPAVWVSLTCCVVYFPVLLVLNGILQSYVKTAWALSYLQLATPKMDTPVIIEANA